MKELSLWKFIKSHIEKDGAVILMVVVDSENSSPGRAGFKMAVTKNKEMIGSIGGGRMEVSLVEDAVKNLNAYKNVLWLKKLYHQGDSHEDSSGMICSGAQTIFTITLESGNIQDIEKIIQSIESNLKSAIKLNPDGLTFVEQNFLQKEIVFNFKNESSWFYQENISHQDKIYIIGGGHVGLALSRVMSLLDFHIVLIDSRPSLKTMEVNHFANEKKVISYNEILNHLDEGDHSYIAIVSHTHETDKLTLQKLLDKNFKYIGMMGSKSKVKNVMNELRQLGYNEDQLKRIHSPIGIEINSETPEEIAISIAAEIIKVRNS
ncbi:MAG: XdhC family protein [Ignavibacteriaceae bacterium]|nr:XdhC family protein [Ignavibacteriaceae bacterium]